MIAKRLNPGVVHNEEIKNKAQKLGVLGPRRDFIPLQARRAQENRAQLIIRGEPTKRLNGECDGTILLHWQTLNAKQGFVNHYVEYLNTSRRL